MANLESLLLFTSKFISLFLLLLLLHLGCFFFPSSTHPPKKLKPKPHKSLSSPFSFLKGIFTPKPKHSSQTHPNPSTITPSSSSSARSSHDSPIPPPDPPSHQNGSNPESDISTDHHFSPLRNDIYPCPDCGEIFLKSTLLDHHKSTKHAVLELADNDSGNNIVRIIFKTGWPEESKSSNPNIYRVLKIRNGPNTLTRFEDYRESVKLRASLNGAVSGYDERCIADGNELLRFHCSTVLCELGQNGNSSVCTQQYCSVCGIIRSGFSPKVDGISTLSTAWRGHVAVPREIEEEEFGFLRARRAMVVCRVIAGRVGRDPDSADKEGVDSVVVVRGGGVQARFDDQDELLVFNQRAVLPCFVILYTV